MSNVTPPATVARTANLALIFQEVLTATVRLRSNRQAVSDAESFRHHTREASGKSARKMRATSPPIPPRTSSIGVTFAVAGFLDETRS